MTNCNLKNIILWYFDVLNIIILKYFAITLAIYIYFCDKYFVIILPNSPILVKKLAILQKFVSANRLVYPINYRVHFQTKLQSHLRRLLGGETNQNGFIIWKKTAFISLLCFWFCFLKMTSHNLIRAKLIIWEHLQEFP